MGRRRSRPELFLAAVALATGAARADAATPVVRLGHGALVIDARHVPSGVFIEIRRDRYRNLYVLDLGDPVDTAPRACRPRLRGGSATSTMLCAGGSVDRVEVHGGPGADRVFVAVPVPTIVRAGGGNDTVGRPEYQVSAPLTIVGGSGDDGIQAWGLDDRVDAGPGDDVVELATVTPRHAPACGPGADALVGSALPATHDCEGRLQVPVVRLPGVTRPARPETSAPSPIAASRSLVALGGHGVGVELGCPSLPFTADCAVVLRLDAARWARRAGAGADPARLAHGYALLYAGQHATVGLQLTPRGRRLARRGAFPAQLAIVPVDPRAAPARFAARFERDAPLGHRGVLDLADDLQSAPLPAAARPAAPDGVVAVHGGVLGASLSASSAPRATVRRMEDGGAYLVAARGAAVGANAGCRLVAADSAACAGAAIDSVTVETMAGGGSVATTVPVPSLLDGGPGPDALSVASGPSTLLGGAGDDTIDAGPGDDVACGPGDDSVSWSLAGLPPDCEHRLAPAPVPPVGAPGPPTSDPVLALIRPRLTRLGTRRLLADLACASSPTASCDVVLELRDVGSRRLLARTRIVLGLGRGSAALELTRAGSLRRVLVALTATAAGMRYSAGAVIPVA